MLEGLLSALCLVAVLEGLFLFVTPDGWKRTAERLYALSGPRLRLLGGLVAAAGLISLWLVRR
jgi:uncharacterized protein YjeT (DUF2065 family)